MPLRWAQVWLGIVVLLGLCAPQAGCQPELPNTRVGTLCEKNRDCTYQLDSNGKVVQVQVCVRNPPRDHFPAESEPRICTRKCAARTDCPQGFECIYSAEAGDRFCFRCRGHFDCPAGTFCEEVQGTDVPDGGTPPRVCVERSVPRGDFGKDCAVGGDRACDTAAGFFCHGEVPDDPDAYCTKTCQSDADCYTTMYCGTADEDNVPVGKKRRCLQRTLCSSCRSDVECVGLNSLCVLDDQGRGFCTRPCDPEARMPCTVATAGRGYLECREARKAGTRQEVVVNACVPRYGRCYGTGNVCDPCRPHTPEDCQSCGPTGCQRIPGRRCVQTERGEGLCLQECTTSDQCGDNPKLDATLRCARFGQDRVCSASSMALTCWP